MKKVFALLMSVVLVSAFSLGCTPSEEPAATNDDASVDAPADDATDAPADDATDAPTDDATDTPADAS